MLLTISYISNASENLTNQDIEILMLRTKIFNDNNDINGILIYSDFTFFQVIEGEYSKIVSLFESIKRDYRHYNILKILEIKSTKKKYHKYNIKFIIQYNKKASAELIKMIQKNNTKNIIDPKLHNLIVYQSKSLLNLI